MDIYPSTDDPVAGGGSIEQDVLSMVDSAGDRYEAGGAGGFYFASTREGVRVCAVGAVIVADLGIETAEELELNMSVTDIFEQQCTRAAKAAMVALDQVAADLYPRAADLHEREEYNGDFFGPLEVVNERYSDVVDWAHAAEVPDRKTAVLAIFRETSRRIREGELDVTRL